ncbi:MAG TPA: TetR/AcrR family transcriptional regulator [Pseudonocardia sp.]|nr:TetR/AcrR family transcriptional regulator [Pseudonocardia sp.]
MASSPVSSTASSTGRTWAGSTLDARRDARRGRLLAVGLELLGGPEGAAAVTVRSVCRHAKLTDRYFYESFADRDELLLAVYDEVAEQAQLALVDAVSSTPPETPDAVARAAVRAFLGLLTDDPRKGRVLLLAPMSDPLLSQHALRLQLAFGELIRIQLAAAGGGREAAPIEQRLTASALIGALTQLFIRWLDGSLEVSPTELADYCVRLLLTSVPLARPTTS